MNITITLETKLEMGVRKDRGTGCMGYMPDGTRYDDLLLVFGQPQAGLSSDGKIKAEWYGRINGMPFTLYDYKSPLAPEKNTDWHIGGNNHLAADFLVAHFNAVMTHKGDAK
ncbi:MAG: hypothetical protein NTX59_02910 [Elusimicrobia bacterium]|nr:hypothetical protein [Elusimicrobiota bacterium]